MGEVSALHRLTHPGGRWLTKREAQRAGVGRQEGPFNFVGGHSLSGHHLPSLLGGGGAHATLLTVL